MVIPRHKHIIFFGAAVLTIIRLCLAQNELEDVSDQCIDHKNITKYLNYGMGTSDAAVTLIASSNPVHCSIRFIVPPKIHIILVIEFPDWIYLSPPCGSSKNKVYVMVRNTEQDICPQLKRDKVPLFRLVGPHGIHIRINAKANLDTIKMITTSCREEKKSKCSSTDEIACKFGSKTYCMTKSSLCNGHLNCGVPDHYDEDLELCTLPVSTFLTPHMVVVAVWIVFLSFMLISACLQNVLPKRRGHFVYKEDYIVSQKDRLRSQKYVEVKLRKLDSPHAPLYISDDEDAELKPNFKTRLKKRLKRF